MDDKVCPNCGGDDFDEVWENTFQCNCCGNIIDEKGAEF